MLLWVIVILLLLHKVIPTSSFLFLEIIVLLQSNKLIPFSSLFMIFPIIFAPISDSPSLMVSFFDFHILSWDYKPEETPYITSRISYSFIRSIPQVTSYALVLKNLFNINDIMCITFNKSGAWIYEPKTTLTHLNNFIKKKKQYKASDRPWEKYFL